MGAACCKDAQSVVPGEAPSRLPTLDADLRTSDSKLQGTGGGDSSHSDVEASRLFTLGQNYEKGLEGMPKEPSKAFECFLQAAELGHTRAEIRVGFYYDVGFGCSEDPERAAYWYRKAAAKNEPKALFSLGLCYAKGIGVAKDEVEALKLFAQSAELGYDRAIYNLGYCYEQGIGCAQDLSRAMVLYRRACDAGNAFARQRLGLFAARDGQEAQVDAPAA